MPNIWQFMTPAERDAALAEKLGWASDVIYWRLPKGRLVHKKIESPTQSWEGMGLVVEAMAARGFEACLCVRPGGLTAQADFWKKGKRFGADAKELSAATAEAAWKVLGGE